MDKINQLTVSSPSLSESGGVTSPACLNMFGIVNFLNKDADSVCLTNGLQETAQLTCICSNSTIETLEKMCEHISHLFLVFLLLTLNKKILPVQNP